MADLGNSSVLSQTDASNASGTMPSWSGSAAPSTLDDAGRALQGAITREWNWRSFTLTAGGTADVKTLTYSVAPAAYYNGQRFSFIANTTNTTTVTLNVNTLGAKNIKSMLTGTLADLSAGDMVSGMYVEVAYNTSNDCFVWVNQGSNVRTNVSNTFTANQNISTGSSDGYWTVTADAAKSKGVIFKTGGVNRWVINSDNTAESGTNAGSDFALYSYTDAGSYSTTPLKITRSNAVVTVDNTVAFNSLSNFALKKDVGSGNPGLLFDSSDYLQYDRSTNKFTIVIGGSTKFTVDSNGATAAGYTSLGTITTTSGTTQALGSLTLTNYKFLRLVFNGVSHTGGSGTTINLNTTPVTNGFTGTGNATGILEIDLTTGITGGLVGAVNNVGSTTTVTTATTTLTVAPSSGSFDAGSITVYAI